MKLFPTLYGRAQILRTSICAYDEVTGEWRKVCNKELYNLCSLQGVYIFSAYVIHGEV